MNNVNWISKASKRDSKLRLQDQPTSYLPEEFDIDEKFEESFLLGIEIASMEGQVGISNEIIDEDLYNITEETDAIRGILPENHSLL